MPTRFYLRTLTATDPPSANRGTYDVDLTGGTWNQMTTASEGATTHTTRSGASSASTLTRRTLVWKGVSPPLTASGNIGTPGSLLKLYNAYSQSNGSANFSVISCSVYILKADGSTDSFNAFSLDQPGTEPSATSSYRAFTFEFVRLNQRSFAAGDRIVLELYGNASQSMATSYTIGFAFGGDTVNLADDTATTRIASYAEFSENLPLTTQFNASVSCTSTATGTLPQFQTHALAASVSCTAAVTQARLRNDPIDLEGSASCLASSINASLTTQTGHALISAPQFSSAEALTMPSSQYWNAVLYGNGIYLALGSYDPPRNATSTDGTNWTVRDTGLNFKCRAGVFVNGVFYVLGEKTTGGDTILATTTDGITYTQINSFSLTTYPSLVDIAYGDGKFVILRDAAADRGVLVATDPAGTWTPYGSFSTNTGSIRYAAVAGKWFAKGLTNTTLNYSTDAITWNTVTLPFSSGSHYTAANDSLVVCLGNTSNDRAMYSTDGVTWNSSAQNWSGTSAPGIPTVMPDGSFFCPALQGRGVYFSRDGISWDFKDGVLPWDGNVAYGQPALGPKLAVLPARLSSAAQTTRGATFTYGGGVVTATASLITDGRITAAVSALCTATGTLPAGSDTTLTASIAAVASRQSAALTTGISMAGSAAVVSSVINASFTVPINLAASIAAQSSALSASLITALRLNAVVSAQTVVTGAALATQIRAQTSIAAVSATSGALTTQTRLAATVSNSSTVTAELTSQIRLNASVAAVAASTSANLFTVKRRGGNTANNGNGTATLSLLIPAAVRGGDVLTVGLTIAGGTGVTISGVPSGWALLNRTDNGTALAQAIYWKVASGSPDATSPEAGTSPQWIFTNNKASGALDAWYDAKPDAPYFVSGQANASSTSITAPGGTTAFQFTMAVWVFGTATNTTQTSVPGTFSQQDASSGNPATATIASYQNQPGTGVTVPSLSATVGTAAENIGHLLFIQTENPFIGGTGSVISAATGALSTQTRFAANATASTASSAALTTQLRLASGAATASAASATLTGVAAVLEGSAEATATVTANLAADTLLAAAVEVVASATGSATTTIRLAGALSSTAASTGVLTTAIQLAAAADSNPNVVLASLNTGIPLTGALAAQAAATANVSTAVLLVGATNTQAASQGALTTAVQLAAAPTVSSALSGQLTVGGQFAATVMAASTTVADLTTQLTFNASTSAVSAGAAALTADIRLASDVGVISAASGGLATDIRLNSSATSQASVTGALTTVIHVAAGVEVVGTTTGALTTSIQLAVDAAAQTNNVLASLNTGIPLTASIESAATATSTLTTSIQLTGSIAGFASTLQADLQVAAGIALAGSAAAETAAVGTLFNYPIELVAGAAAVAATSGSVTTGIRLAGSVAAASEGAGALLTEVNLAGSGAVAATASGALTTDFLLSGAESVSSAGSGDLTTGIALAGSAFNVSSTTADLESGSRLNGELVCIVTVTGTLGDWLRVYGPARDVAYVPAELGGMAVPTEYFMAVPQGAAAMCVPQDNSSLAPAMRDALTVPTEDLEVPA